jgi:1-acyl-sn-glycerol-3-phosphate acyltransferase
MAASATSTPPTIRGKRIVGFPHRFPIGGVNHPPLRYSFVKGFCYLYSKLLFRGGYLHIEGEENIPKQGPFIIAVNHLSNFDAMMIAVYFPYTVFSMAKQELFFTPIANWFFSGMNAFPIDRGAPDRWAIRTAINLLKGSGRLVMFVEGTRSLTGSMRKAEPGTGFLARKTSAPVLPMAIWGTEKVMERGKGLPRRAHVHIKYGQPFMPSGGEDQEISDSIAKSIAELLPEEYRGVYA